MERKNRVAKYATLLARLHGFDPAEAWDIDLPFWEGEGLSCAEINKILHRMHSEDPSLRREAISLLSEGFEEMEARVVYPAFFSSDLEECKAEALRQAASLQLERRFDVVALGGATWVWDHTAQAQGQGEENPVLILKGGPEDLQDAVAFLEGHGWKRRE